MNITVYLWLNESPGKISRKEGLQSLKVARGGMAQWKELLPFMQVAWVRTQSRSRRIFSVYKKIKYVLLSPCVSKIPQSCINKWAILGHLSINEFFLLILIT